MNLNPMHQFEVYKIGPEINLGGLNLSFTNASLFMIISAILITLLLFFGTKPLLIICFFFMGVTAGILNVFRSAKKMHKEL